jgi:hypothetical protein
MRSVAVVVLVTYFRTSHLFSLPLTEREDSVVRESSVVRAM